MTTTIAPQGYVLGDGTTAGQVATDRWRRWRWGTFVGLIVITSLIAMAYFAPSSSTAALAIDNPQPEGAMALAEVLRDHGVEVVAATTLEQAHDLLDGDGTLVIATYSFIDSTQAQSINAYEGPVVWLEPDSFALGEIDPALTYEPADVDDRVTLSAACRVPTPERAGSVNVGASRIAVEVGTPLVVVCFSNDAHASGAYVHVVRADRDPVIVLSDSSVVTNAYVAKAGNAALAIGILGTREKVVWYTGADWDDTTLTSDQGASEYYTPQAPPWLAPAMLAAVLALVFAAVWQGRRFGALVTEPLPLIVRASEATRGRARLYRRGGARDHALAALRAGAAQRMASRLALPRSTSPEALVAAIARATGRDGAQVRSLLYDARPQDDAGMVDLVRRIDALESEVDPT